VGGPRKWQIVTLGSQCSVLIKGQVLGSTYNSTVDEAPERFA